MDALALAVASQPCTPDNVSARRWLTSRRTTVAKKTYGAETDRASSCSTSMQNVHLSAILERRLLSSRGACLLVA